MPWIVELTKSAADALDKLDTATRNRIRRFLRERLQGADNPRQWGKALTGRYAGLWRYRLGDYRLVCQLQDARLVVLVVQVARRDKAYIGA
ncbi:MAG TPA: type II toxin-antitoxin system RelE/ParE family toxin [Candidatus Competibacteraceae bacterium]|nr:type II toxin-antitoxin system RelE/ParE family toxin [Candidatus Contendobacter sp.]RUQ38577.1 MAG: type II toxin-antitoxin system RelE/ParE family toxin [Candidatus Competibacteraceae bacterium]HQC71565.1 type II toxin-antitoxin system RelE/ParE family toxin [Candidatus Competibacteraceae bacterium]